MKVHAFKNPVWAVVMAGVVLSGPAAFADGDVQTDSVGHRAQVVHLAGEHPITLGAGVTMVGQGVDGPLGSDGGVTYSVDIALEGEVGELGTAFVYINSAQGTSVTTVPSEGGFNADDEAGDVTDGGYSDTRIAEAWLNIPLGSMASLTVGKIDPTGIYDGNEYANDETSQFLGDTFVNNMAIGFPGYAGGLSLEVAPTESLTLNVGAFELTDDFDGSMRGGFLIGEGSLSHDAMGGGNVRLTYWQAENNELANPGNEVDASGIAVNIDQAISASAGLFLRYGTLDEDVNAGAFDAALSFGGQYTKDTCVLGVGYSMLAATGAGADDETQLEIYLNHAVSEVVHVTADVQFMSGAGTDPAADDITVYGLRMQVDL